MRYFIHLAYNGLPYNGWQKQTLGISVQSVLEEQLQKIFKIPINTIGCGRTDASVHASQFFIHFDFEEPFDTKTTVFRLNKTLPPEIVLYDIIPMAGLPHARFDAIHRQYDYFIHTEKNPFSHGLSTLYAGTPLNLKLMAQAVALLPKYNDYRSFCISPNKYEHTICNITHAKLFTNEDQTRIRFQIGSNRFLGRMIRIIIHKLFEIGQETLSVSNFEQFLIDRTTPKEIVPADPRGLYLSKVTYPYLDLPSKQPMSCINLSNSINWIEIKTK